MRRALCLPLLLLLGLVLPSAAAACSCVRVPEAERLRDADAAFAGTLISRRAVDPESPGQSTGDPFIHRYRVDRRYKGRLGRTVRVRTVRDEATCGVPARRRIALYLTRANGRWQSSLCASTTRRAMRRAARGAGSATAGGCPA